MNQLSRLRIGRLEGGLMLLVLMAALLSRLVGLDRYTGSYPEGIRAEQLLLMAHGFRPFHDIFSDQGPWLLQALYPGYAALGGTLVGLRITVVAASLVGLFATAWVARQLAGRWAGLAALLLLTLSPIYLQFSRIAVAEILALAPATLALGCALRRASGGSARWVLAASLLLATSLLLKPITLGAGPAVALALLLGPRPRRDLAFLSAVTTFIVLLGVLAVGWREIFQQIVQFRAASRDAEGWSLAENLKRFRVELAPEGLALFVLAGLGALLVPARKSAWPLLVWILGAAGTVVLHSPLHSKHFSVIVVPLVALAAYAIGRSWDWLEARQLPAQVSRLALAFAILLTLAFLGGTLQLVRRDAVILTSQDLAERDGARQWYADATATLRRVLQPGEYVVTDHAYLAWAADRLIPPSLVEASATRVRAGSLTDALAIQTTRDSGARAVLLWADKLADLKRYQVWLTENYVPAKLWAAEGDTRPVLWLRNDDQLPRDRLALARDTARINDASFGDWRLVGARLSGPTSYQMGDEPAFCPGQDNRLTVALAWESVDPASDGRVELTLRRNYGDRSVVDSEQEPLLGPIGRPRWLYWVGGLRVPTDGAFANYAVAVRLLDSRGRPLGDSKVVGRVATPSC